MDNKAILVKEFEKVNNCLPEVGQLVQIHRRGVDSERWTKFGRVMQKSNTEEMLKDEETIKLLSDKTLPKDEIEWYATHYAYDNCWIMEVQRHNTHKPRDTKHPNNWVMSGYYTFMCKLTDEEYQQILIDEMPENYVGWGKI